MANGNPKYLEMSSAFSSLELSRALAFLKSLESEEKPQSFTPLDKTTVRSDDSQTELSWLTEKMLEIATAADEQAGWCLRKSSLEVFLPSDDLIYNRFGDNYSDVTFNWHCDDSDTGPRDLSVVAYFTDPDTYEGGDLEIQLPRSSLLLDPTPGSMEVKPKESGEGDGAAACTKKCELATAADSKESEASAAEDDVLIVRRRFAPGHVVAFPSKTLMHRDCTDAIF
eukprot:TRINITY_DN21965_c0_g1_i1.p1 TRINITY_DN21965_c0_g1~~TRINITY_DN21965_c0_g1_i1.p1  ORF type:complete len:237 (-),score=46.48 TRINITY_DN21965_c0_g1_i1:74-751(-)